VNKTYSVKHRKHIDLTGLSGFLRSEWRDQFHLDGHHMQIIEEVVFLCANVEFIRDIENIRRLILKKCPEVVIPTTNYYMAKGLLVTICRQLYGPYRKSIQSIIEKYKLLPPLYWQDQFRQLDSNIKDEMRGSNFYGKQISKKEARLLAIEEIAEDIELTLLDSIVLRNEPFDTKESYPFWVNPLFTRKTDHLGGITIKLNKVGIPHLEIGFPPYATLSDMQAILKQNYKKIQEHREAHLPVSKKRDHRKDNLPKMIDAYLMHISGEGKPTIANFLDKRYGGSISYEGVMQLLNRMNAEASRFSSGKQET
jgi:hypothetical protein